MKNLIFSISLLFCLPLFAQEGDESQKSVIQEYTPSKLLEIGQWDIKWFNNLYTQTNSTFTSGKEPRESYFTSSLEVFTGVSKENRLNVGVFAELRSNVINDRNALDVFKFDGETNSARSGLTSFAVAVKFSPLRKVSNFSVLSAFHIPLVDNEVENGVFLDQKGFIWQNKLFYDFSFSEDKFQLYTELNTEFNFGKSEDSFANNSLNLVPGLFLSYFPSQKFTLLVLAQHNQRLDLGNDFEQNFSSFGGGAKYQISRVLNVEALYTNFIWGHNTGLGETFNLGLRALFH
ncbi:MAG: hypothetical protein BM564_12605 [Bacteroidetes bacterium MedPE-SWsnd-G2]|nr:MAG: hypothetical protein BM564_12605 [Bacteroidetes bacterium MedPE-SWsnd-G2]